MAISFACENCGKGCKVGDELAGLTGRCGGCGHLMAIPGRPVVPTGGREGSSFGRLVVIAVVGLVVLGALARLFLPAIRAARQVEQERADAEARARSRPLRPGVMPAREASPAGDAGPSLPSFPGPGPGREIAPGVMFHEVVLGPADRPAGQGGKLWLYLPAGEHADGSLPCILIAPAGSNLLTGNDLGDDPLDPERLPYVRAGFAVLAYELDGALDSGGDKPPAFPVLMAAMRRFLAAKAGLANAGVALEYLLAKVPQVDPERISAVGHSSAGTLAVLFAEHEPRLESCVAFAPALDLEQRFGAEAVAQLKRAGVGDLAVRYSPRADEKKLACPLFLFHARDDSNVPVAESEAFAARLQGQGKSVTLELVDDGDHYQSMIDQGIPRAIAWLKGSPPAEKP